jgi:hypothetical protein
MRDPTNMIKTHRGYMDAYLVETHSLGGLSGSPVVVPAEPIWIANAEIKRVLPDHRQLCLLGLVHGRFALEDENDVVLEGRDDEDGSSKTIPESYDELNAGIAVVVPIDKVLEVINQDRLARKREGIAKASRERSGVK